MHTRTFRAAEKLFKVIHHLTNQHPEQSPKRHSLEHVRKTHQPVEELQLQRGDRGAELGGVGARGLAALHQVEQSSIHAQSLGSACAKALEVEYGAAQEGDLSGTLTLLHH